MPDEFADNGKSCKAYTEGGADMRGGRQRDDGWDEDRRDGWQNGDGYQPDTAAGYQGTGYPNGAGTRARVTTRPGPDTATRLPALVRDMAPRGTTPGATPHGYPDSG